MIQSQVYKLSRTEMARIASEEYLRSFWWLVAPIPLIGLGAIIFTKPPLQVFGMLMFLWPFSIPARSVLSTTKSSRLFSGGCHVEATDDEVVFIGEYINQKRLRYAIAMDRIKEIVPRRDILLIRLRIPGIAPIRTEAFATDKDREAFLKLVNDAIERRLTETEEEPESPSSEIDETTDPTA